MKSPRAVKRTSNTTTNVNRRKGLGRTAKKAREVMKQWCLTAIVIRDDTDIELNVSPTLPVKKVEKAQKKAEQKIEKKPEPKQEKKPEVKAPKQNETKSTKSKKNTKKNSPQEPLLKAAPSSSKPEPTAEIIKEAPLKSEVIQQNGSIPKSKKDKKDKKDLKQQNGSVSKGKNEVNEVSSNISDKENQSDPENDKKTDKNKDKKLLENVQKLATQVAAKIEHKLDPATKMHIDAQLTTLSNKINGAERERSATPVLNVVTPLPIQNISRPVTPTMRERLHKLLPQDILFCARLLDTYGENYEAMVNDPSNTSKQNSRSLQRKIRIFKESPHYQTYVNSKKDGVPLDQILAKQIA